MNNLKFTNFSFQNFSYLEKKVVFFLSFTSGLGRKASEFEFEYWRHLEKQIKIFVWYFRCAKLVMNCLSTFDDPSMNRMSVAICSILAAKISTVETSMLGAKPQYMAKLLSLVRSKLQAKLVDVTMKFTLSALWNLTDESATTCKVFLEEGGMELFLEALEKFRGESSIETKVLGLLNNIAEVG